MDHSRNEGQLRQGEHPGLAPARDQADGSRETVRGREDQNQQGGGISNRPDNREEEQQGLPERGQSREENR